VIIDQWCQRLQKGQEDKARRFYENLWH